MKIDDAYSYKLEAEYIKLMSTAISEEGGFDEMAHKTMDNILCILLWELGYKNLVKLYESTEKWYE